VPPFQISVPSSISFGTSDTSLTFTITTVDGGHALGSYQDFSIVPKLMLLGTLIWKGGTAGLLLV
jgi:hypothetical protein